jgi:two-component system cell cycle sensor histidine kinase/response regulator CckA
MQKPSNIPANQYPRQSKIPSLDERSLLDIGELKQAQQALEVSEANYRAIFDMANDAILIHDAETGAILDVNRKMTEMYGYIPEEARQLNVEALSAGTPPYTREDTLRWMGKAAKGEPQLFEWKCKDKAGRIFWGEVNLKRVTIGGMPRLLAIVRDITERKRAEEAMRKSEEHYRQLLGSATDYIYSVKIENGHWLATSHSPGCIAVTGYSPEEYQTDPQLWYRMVHPNDHPAVFEQAAKAHSGEVTPPLEHRIIHKDGSVRWLRNTIALQRNDQGQVIFYDGLVNDITERKRAEEVLRQTEDQLRQSQKLEAIGRLAGGVAHDFNNLLTAIMGYTDFLLMSLNPDDPRHSDAKEIRKASEQAATLTRQLLAFSRKQDLQPRILDLNAVVTDSAKILRRLLGEDIDLNTGLDPSLWMVKADPGQLEQVIINIAVNSRDAMPDGGRLIVETANVNLDEEYCRQHPSTKVGCHVMLAISDTGCGMDVETQSQIFEPFFTTKEQGKGTGLGLSTAYGIIKQSGGSIWVNSELGKGTVVEIYLPRVEGEIGVLDNRLTENQKQTVRGTECLLLVEDEEAVRNLVCETLRRSGYMVLEAPNGGEALRLATEYVGPIHLMVTDLVMPEINGRRLAERMATVRPNMRVLYMSGHTASVVAPLGILEPGVAFLQKPFSPDMLARRIREVLDSPKEGQGAEGGKPTDKAARLG